MSPSILAVVNRLSHELVLFCDDDMVVREANPVALTMLGPRLIGRPLLQLFSAMARPKGAAFLDELRGLEGEAVSATWELLLHRSRAAHALVELRGSRSPEGGWVIIGASEPPHLTALYHEVLGLNAELSELIRNLTRQQASLSAQIAHLLSTREQHNADHT
jgi:hypothetical protein